MLPGAAYKFSRLDRRLRAELQNEVSRSYVSLRYFDDPWDSLWMKGMEDLVNSFDQVSSLNCLWFDKRL